MPAPRSALIAVALAASLEFCSAFFSPGASLGLAQGGRAARAALEGRTCATAPCSQRRPMVMHLKAYAQAEEDMVAAAKARAERARKARRLDAIIGSSVPEDWEEGVHFSTDLEGKDFVTGEIAVLRGKFVRVTVFDEDSKMFSTEVARTPQGSTTIRKLGKKVLSKIASADVLDSALDALVPQ